MYNTDKYYFKMKFNFNLPFSLSRFLFVKLTEMLIQSGGNSALKKLRNSIEYRTIIFMILSATLLDTLRVINADIFW